MDASKVDFMRLNIVVKMGFMLTWVNAVLSASSTEQLSTIFEQCCQEPDSCLEWRPLFSGNSSATIQAICSLASITCDSEQNIIELKAPGMGLTCNLPDAPIQELQKLQSLDLSNNRISGPIPEFLPESLVEIRMNNNELIGAVPHSLATHPNLETLRLDYNQIESLPIEWTSMVYDASNSPFPLQAVHLGHNTLQGSFPQGLAYFPLLRVLELQHNTLSGPIEPKDSSGAFRQLNLLDVSDNSLSGTLPSWTDSVKTFIAGTGNTFTTASDSNASSSGLSGGAIAGIVIGVLVGVGCIATAIVLLLIRKRKSSTTTTTKEPSNAYERYI
ncbi:hypothetical protein M9434_006093 [Picochlorum sp. BPE23]|nr:hypothetical protein M9434_006093 [Picochlorum sp. BPE23]